MVQLVALHGLNNDAGVWDAVAAALPTQLTVHAPMLPPLDDIDEVADWVAAQFTNQAILIGHSFGGAVAQALYARHRERVQGLVLVTASIRADSPQQASGRIQRAEALQSEADYEQMANGSPQRLFSAEHATDSQILATRRESVSLYGLERFRAHTKALAGRSDVTALIAQADIPKLVVAASEDVVIPASSQQQWASEVGAEFETISNAGHMLPAEQPQRLGEVITQFVTRHFPHGS